MIIVLDTNVLRGDVHARRPLLRAVLEGAAQGDFELLVPEVVIEELIKQYPQRLQKVLKDLSSAIGKHSTELRALQLEVPSAPEVDHASATAAYAEEIRERFSGDGARIAEMPDLRPAAAWAVHRRKPFKPSGEGLQDAAVWLTVLDAAPATELVLLVSANTKDFGDGGETPGLAEDLQQGLRELDLPADRVRLVSDLRRLVEEVVEPAAEADARAARLLSDADFGEKLRSKVEDALLYRSIAQDGLRLGIHLDDDPQAVAMDVYEVELVSAREVDGDLLLDLRAQIDLTVDAYVYRADWYAGEDDTPLTLGDPDWNEHFVQAEAEIATWVRLEVATDAQAEHVEVELAEVERMRDEELVSRRLRADAGSSLGEELSSLIEQESRHLDYYRPERPLEGPMQEALLSSFVLGTVELVELEEARDDGWLLTVQAHGHGDVRWLVSTPTGSDLVEHADSMEGDPDAGGWLSASVELEPVTLLLSGELGFDGSWSGLELYEGTLEQEELERRERTMDPPPDFVDEPGEAAS